MTLYQIYTRIKHFFMARHWRGAAIHSPMMYTFVREYALKNRKSKLIEAIGSVIVDSVEDLEKIAQDLIVSYNNAVPNEDQGAENKGIEDVVQEASYSDGSLQQFNNMSKVVVLREPFRSRREKERFEKWFNDNHVVTAHFQGLIVIFFDKKLQKQQFVIRN